jgi:hypothetical protein
MNNAFTGGENTRKLTMIFVSNGTPAIVSLRTLRAFRRLLLTVEAITCKPSLTI